MGTLQNKDVCGRGSAPTYEDCCVGCIDDWINCLDTVVLSWMKIKVGVCMQTYSCTS